MDALTAITERHSSREFLPKTIAREVLEKIVDAGHRAPTARNKQPWEFVVVTNADSRKTIADLATHGKFIAQAPACIAVLCHDTYYYLEDGCAATENMLIAAAALGVQTCWVAGDKKEYAAPVLKLLGVPDGLKLIALIALGYETRHPEPKVRRDLAEILHWEKF